MFHSTGATNPSYRYTLNHSLLKAANTYKYLGIHLTSDLSWSTHIDHISSLARKSLGYLQRTLKHAPTELKLQAYTTLVHPKLQYASAIWDPYQDYLSNQLEAIQNRAVRFAYSDFSSFTSVTELKNRANLPVLRNHRKLAKIALFHRFCHSLSPNKYITPRRVLHATVIIQCKSLILALEPPHSRTHLL